MRPLLALTASAILLLCISLRTVYSYKSLNQAKRVGHFGLIISFSILTLMFAAKYLGMDVKVNVLHVAIIVLIPLLVYWYLEKRKKEEEPPFNERNGV